MSSRIIPAARALGRFDALLRQSATAMDDEATPGPSAPELTRERLEELRRQAYEEGMQAGLQQARAAFEQERERLVATHAEELRQHEQRWRLQTAEQLATMLMRGLEELEQALGEHLAEVLQPLLPLAARRQALRQMRETLHNLLQADAALRVQVCGPADMLEALREALKEHAARLQLQEDDGMTELLVHIDDSVIETRMQAWVRQVVQQMQEAAQEQDASDGAHAAAPATPAESPAAEDGGPAS